ncbi:MAG: 2-oxoglutarate dehydrogenase, component, dihydrolipoamide succinyltransferase, partial [Myxococcaceae bacterium]|nr:2-oxoglutarate dehydrogenase, component, dihydrolipoamide succinyltransferase [Myxococcaceae bacterium]
MSTTVTMPQLGESVVEGTIGKWLVQEGDRVERDQAVVEILTDKADSEVPSPVAGTVSKLLAKEDEVVRVGVGLFVIEEGGAATQPSAPPAQAAAPKSDPKAEAKGKGNKSGNEIPPPPAPAAAKPAEPQSTGAKPADAKAPAYDAASAPRNGGPAAMATASGSPSQRKAAREQGVDLAVAARPGAALAPAPQAVASVPGPAGKKS